MVYAIVAHIIFAANERRGEIAIRRVNGVQVESSWKNQTDWCEVTLPRNVRDFDKNRIRDLFRRGDKAVLYIGYNGNLYKEFEGYITSVSADIPVVIKMEDEMWKLKQLPVNVSMNKTTLPDLMAAIAPGYSIDALEIELGTVRFSKTTVAEVLKQLKDNFDLYSYFQGSTLVVGKIYSDNTARHRVRLERDCSSHDLKYITGENKVVEVTAVSTLSNGEKLEVKVGDEGGEQRQLTYYNIASTDELKKLAEADYARMKQDGFEGGVDAFGYIQAQHGDEVELESSQYEERNGIYKADAVKVTMDDSPKYRRTISLGLKVS